MGTSDHHTGTDSGREDDRDIQEHGDGVPSQGEDQRLDHNGPLGDRQRSGEGSGSSDRDSLTFSEDDENGETINPAAGKPVREEVSKLTGHEHPFVSETKEGKPWFEWIVAGFVVLSAVLALFRQFLPAVILLSSLSIVVALMRLILRERSPWKVRSIAFDVIVGLGLGIGLIGTYASILAISR